jgi:hypothetical protein
MKPKPKTYTSAQVHEALRIRDSQWGQRLMAIASGMGEIIQPMLQASPDHPPAYPADLAEFFMAPPVNMAIPPARKPKGKNR